MYAAVYRGIDIRGRPAYVYTAVYRRDGHSQSDRRYAYIPSRRLQLRKGLSEQKSSGDVNSEQHRWELISDFVDSSNDHRSAHVSPSEYICVDESMCKWYGLGGSWIQRGPPMYVAKQHKPENGCEVQNAACGRSGIMLQLSAVTSAEHQKAAGMTNDDNVPHGAAVLKKLSAPWAGTQRVVSADSYFASVPVAIELRKMGLRFSGVLKTATRGFPMQALSTMVLDARGYYASYSRTTADGVVDLMAVVWVDRERRYSSTSTTLPGEPYERMRWRQIDEEAKKVLLTVKLPRVAQEYTVLCCDRQAQPLPPGRP